MLVRPTPDVSNRNYVEATVTLLLPEFCFVQVHVNVAVDSGQLTVV